MSFLIYDIIFLVIFILGLATFLFVKRKNVQREGVLFLYRTKIGIKVIDYFGEKFKKQLKLLRYISVILGYFLMAGILFLLGQALYIYITMPQFVRLVKAPPIAPLIPYFPQIFGLQSFFPPFYFVYFIFAIAIVAIAHEFSHGIFAKIHNLKIKNTGFAFLGPFLGAFVEPDEKKMNKKKKFEQLSILSAGVFANFIVAILFFFVMAGFFALVFAPSGATFNTYAYSIVNISDIKQINMHNLTKPIATNEILLYAQNNTNNYLTTINGTLYIATYLQLQTNVNSNLSIWVLYDNAPAINANLSGAIIKINNDKVTSSDDISNELLKFFPGENITLTTKDPATGYEKKYNITLAANPTNSSKAYLGIGIIQSSSRNVIGKIVSLFGFYKLPFIYYESKIGNAGQFIYDFLWWVALINLLVALFNMIPAAFFDGGRFFLITMTAITRSEKIARKVYYAMGYIILFLLIAMMALWFMGIF
jgi:membrane-associated protease RseP (regulator of RpoE activity)